MYYCKYFRDNLDGVIVIIRDVFIICRSGSFVDDMIILESINANIQLSRSVQL